MSTPPAPGRPQGRRPLEPTRVVRRRRTEALAQLMREHEEAMAGIPDGYESVDLPRPAPGAEDATQELPPVSRRRHAERTQETQRTRSGFGFGPNLRRAAIAVAVGAAALVGFGVALLVPDSAEGEEVRPAPQAAPTTAPAPSAPAPAPADPDGAGTLREGDSGHEVTELQQRLLRIPDVYTGGATSGSYDPTLTEAVARFQHWYGIRGDETGVYGDDTRKDLESRTGS
ncbi:peptidoglycan-binding domain-containing protein [Streptomyces turgidiscabies]|uniref:peptidoglycan-binding domain-containing protein n=1 Tax=Streptomyces turgidiscabies TaxID=85558 RepID=UPI0027D8CB0D|nr:peptidoglycan-binding protein [Streptomyces turgidiscabies]